MTATKQPFLARGNLSPMSNVHSARFITTFLWPKRTAILLDGLAELLRVGDGWLDNSRSRLTRLPP